MEPIEINAGPWYLTAEALDAWTADEVYTWAVREATTAVEVARVTLTPEGDVSGTGEADALQTASDAVERFAATL